MKRALNAEIATLYMRVDVKSQQVNVVVHVGAVGLYTQSGGMGYLRSYKGY